MQTTSSAEGKPAQTSNKNKEEINVCNRITATLTKQFGPPPHQIEVFINHLIFSGTMVKITTYLLDLYMSPWISRGDIAKISAILNL